MRIYDEQHCEKLNAEKWQIDLLRLNPTYVHWGPHEDYMCNKRKDFQGPVIRESWKDFGPWNLDEYNECVHFYFSVHRLSKDCQMCGGNGYHPNAYGVIRSFYFDYDLLVRWNDKITQDELEALVAEGRIKSGTTVEEVNAQNRTGSIFGTHDQINQFILIRARLKRLGITENCPDCDGEGRVYVSPSAHVTLTLWILHPGKGCSRGVEITRIEQEDLPSVYAWLSEADNRNARRFAKLKSVLQN